MYKPHLNKKLKPQIHNKDMRTNLEVSIKMYTKCFPYIQEINKLSTELHIIMNVFPFDSRNC